MKMRGRKTAFWIGTLLVGSLCGILKHYAGVVERAQPGAVLGQISAVGAWLVLGMYVGLYRLLPMFGTGGRWRVIWSVAALGVLLGALGLIARYFSHGEPLMIEGSDLLIVMCGSLLVGSIEKPPAPEEARSNGERPGA